MSLSPQTTWALMLLAGCMLPFIHMTRPRAATRPDMTLVTGALVGLTCSCVAAMYASAGS
jgi:hypothetical protein